MIYTTLAIAALAASSALPNFGSLVHLHSVKNAATDNRVSMTLENNGFNFRDITVDGRTYTVPSKHTLSIKAPVGTAIYAGSTMPGHRRGDLLMTVTPELGKGIIRVN